MKKFALFLMFFTLFGIGNAEQINVKGEPKDYCIKNVSALYLPNGVYFLCCKNGNLILYNCLGQQVGWGPDCGGLPEGDCFRCIVYTASTAPENSNAEQAADVLNLLNSISPDTGESHEGEWCENMETYYYNESEIHW